MLPESVAASSIIIGGPTAIGKTAVAVAVAREQLGRFEIVSADSIQVYKRFDIGSAKPSESERSAVPFHLVDIAEPDSDFTLVDYLNAALPVIVSIVERGRVPLIVGGTGLYVRGITRGLKIPVTGPDEKLRAEYTEQAATYGSKFLHDQLAEVDSQSAARIHENDLKRIIRALEVLALSGRTLTEWHAEDAARVKAWPGIYIALDRSRNNLYGVIDQRTEIMFSSGIIEETAALRRDGFSPSLKPMTSLGYLQANQVLDGTLTKAEAVELTKVATHQYARRQLIWFRGEPVDTWIDSEGKTVEEVARLVIDFAGL